MRWGTTCDHKIIVSLRGGGGLATFKAIMYGVWERGEEVGNLGFFGNVLGFITLTSLTLVASRLLPSFLILFF
jgi:hypothetical protein